MGWSRNFHFPKLLMCILRCVYDALVFIFIAQNW